MISESVKDTTIAMLEESMWQSMTAYRPESSQAFIGNISLLLPLLDTLKNVVFFVKDEQARYQLANKTLLKRCKLHKQ